MSRLTWAFFWQRAAPPSSERLLALLVKFSSPPRSEAGSSGGGKRGKKNHSRSLERRYQMANLEAGEMVGWQDLRRICPWGSQLLRDSPTPSVAQELPSR